MGVAAKGVLKKAGQFAVSVWDMNMGGARGVE